jgi:alanyl-tRNA synthetase
MTQRLYYSDAYRTGFDAIVMAVTHHNGQPAVILDQTYFYPTSGGQLFDTGRLGDRQVVDVVAGPSGRPDGEIFHLLDGELPAASVGRSIHGVIDWPRRYDHMQQHSGQHLLSQVFYRLFGFETVSVHFGAAESTLDLDTPSMEVALLDEAERYANDLIYAGLPIKVYTVTEAELPETPLRRPPKVAGQIRIVEIDRFDYSACGGTHVRTTAEIAPLKLTRLERRRGQTRVTFLCGRRALDDYATKHRLLSQVAGLYSTEMAEAPKLVERSLAQVKELQRNLDELGERLLRYEAADLVHKASELKRLRLVVHLFEDKDARALKILATLLQEQPDMVALLASTFGEKLSVVFACAENVSLHAGNLLRAALQQFGGNGGGRPDFAQGGVADPRVGQPLLDFAMQKIAEQI